MSDLVPDTTDFTRQPDRLDLESPTAAELEGAGCHAGADVLRDATNKAQGSELLARYAADYPVGPHDQPQSMCPAFGSLRVGLRMRRTATVLSGSACCVYGLTFTSHFYGARRTVGYVPFSSETLVTGKLFEDIKEAVENLADPDQYDAIVVTNLCVPTASGVPLRLLKKQINGVRIIGIDVPGFGIPTHAEAKDVLAGAMLAYARSEAEAGPVAAPATRPDRPTVTLLGEMFPADPVGIGMMLEPLGLAAGPVVPTREWRELYAALDCAVVAAIHPFYTASVREFEAAGRPVVGSAPVGAEGTAAWLDAIEAQLAEAGAAVAAARRRLIEDLSAALAQLPDQPFARPDLAYAAGGPVDRAELAVALRDGRRRDRAAQRTLTGPHRDDLVVTMAGKQQPAGDCSTGEQKAMLIAITLAHAGLLDDHRPALLLLDEVAAHLDPVRRDALFDRLRAGRAQVWLTGTELAPFSGIRDEAAVWRVSGGSVERVYPGSVADNE